MLCSMLRAAMACAILAGCATAPPHVPTALVAEAGRGNPAWQLDLPGEKTSCIVGVRHAALGGGSASLVPISGERGVVLVLSPQGASPSIDSGVAYAALWEAQGARIALGMMRFQDTGLSGLISHANDPTGQLARILLSSSILTVVPPQAAPVFRLSFPAMNRDMLVQFLTCIRNNPPGSGGGSGRT